MVCQYCGTDTPAPASACQTCRTPFPLSYTPDPDSATVGMGTGTYCWSEPSRNGICVDAAGPITGTQEVRVSPGQRVVSTGVFKLQPGMPVAIDNTLAPKFTLAPQPDNT